MVEHERADIMGSSNEMLEIRLDGVYGYLMRVPEFIVGHHPTVRYDDIPRFCGAGHGIGELAVPDSILGVRVRLACFYHDLCWAIAPPNWGNFHISNSAFRDNIDTILRKDSNKFMLFVRRHLGLNYYESVDVFGPSIFSKVKRGDANPVEQYMDVKRILSKMFNGSALNSVIATYLDYYKVSI